MEIGIAVAASARPCLLIEDFLSASECEALRQRLEATGITATGGLYPASYRNNDRLVLDDEALAAAFYPRISEHAPAVLSDGERTYVRTRLNPRFRCCRYRDGQRFAIHRDGVYHAASGPAGHERSLLTFMIYLNGDDEFVGGRTRYYTDQSGRQLLRAVVPKRGACILFDHALWHDGEAVTAGTKYVLRSDVLYREVTDSDAPSRANPGYIFTLLPLPDQELASGSRDRTVRIHGAALEERAALSSPTSSIACLAYAGHRLWSGDRDGFLRSYCKRDGHWQPDSARRILDGAVLCLATRNAAQDGADPELFLGGADGIVRTFRIHDGALARAPHAERRGHPGFLHGLLYLCAEDQLLSAGEDGSLRRYQADSELPDTVAEFAVPIHALAADGAHVYAGLKSGEILVLDRRTLALRHRFRAHEGTVRAIAVLPDGRLASGGEDGSVVIVTTSDFTLQRRSQHRDFVTAIAVLSDGNFVSASYDGTLRRHSLLMP